MEEIKIYTCKCENCNREFDEEECQITQDENKCILHCEKDENFLINIEYVEKFHYVFYHFINNISKERKRFYDENGENEKDLKKYEIKNFIFPNFKNKTYLRLIDEDQNVNIFNNITEKNIDVVFENCRFLGDFDLSKEIINFNLIFNNVKINGKLDLSETIFKDFSKVRIKDCEVKNADFYNTKFNNLADFFQTKFNEVNFKRTTFKDISVFTKVTFKDDIDFEYTTFEKLAQFKETIFEKKLNLENTIIKDKINFLKTKTKNNENLKSENVANRETARIIKDSFEQQNNIIEANKFYALEMKEMEKELKFFKKPFEWLVFKIHGMASTHSQDFLLALFWILNITFVTVFLQFELVCENSFVKLLDRFFFFFGGLILLGYGISKLKENFRNIAILLFSIISYFIYSNTYIDDSSLKLFSNTLNPFSIMTGKEELSFGILLYKITIAYLIYQLIISIRQNTRRK